MKKKFIAIALLAAALAAVGCGKDHQCKCVPEGGDNNHLEIVFVGPSIDCEDITETAFEERYTTEDGIHSLRRVEKHKVKCRDYNAH